MGATASSRPRYAGGDLACKACLRRRYVLVTASVFVAVVEHDPVLVVVLGALLARGSGIARQL